MIGAGIDGLQSAESQLVKPGPTCFRPSRELDATRYAQASPQLRPADAAPRGHGLTWLGLGLGLGLGVGVGVGVGRG